MIKVERKSKIKQFGKMYVGDVFINDDGNICIKTSVGSIMVNIRDAWMCESGIDPLKSFETLPNATLVIS